jgi:hypothetical protein
MIVTTKLRYFKRTHKFWIEVPHTVEEALEIDRQTGTDFWLKAIQKEVKNVICAFDFKKPGEQVPIGYKWIPLQMIFDVKMDFT